MPALQGHATTDRPDRYLTQFCKHAAAIGNAGHSPRVHQHSAHVQVSAQWTPAAGTVTFSPWGRCELSAAANVLRIRIDAADEHGLARIRDIVTGDLHRFGGRTPLTVEWQSGSDQPSPQ